MRASDRVRYRWVSLVTLGIATFFAVSGVARTGAGWVGSADVTTDRARGTRFHLEAWTCSSGLVSRWWDIDASLVAQETMRIDSGRWVEYRLERPAAAQQILARREGDTIHIDFRQGDRVKTRIVRASRDVLAGPSLVSFLAERLPSLRRGEGLRLDFLVPEHALVITLRAQQAGLLPDGRINVRLEAENPWVRPFVPTTYLTFDSADQFVSLRGRLVPVSLRAGRLDPLDGILTVQASDVARPRVASMQSGCNTRSLT